MNKNDPYDCVIIGGGVAGLSLSILLARQGYSVATIEKHTYPFQKVCGEYISNESSAFFHRLGLPLDEWKLPRISELAFSSSKGYTLHSHLDQGGFGLSRYKLDGELAKLARASGVTLFEGTTVTGVTGNNIATNKFQLSARLIFGAFGKSRPLFAKDSEQRPRNNYIGVKYHVRTSWPVHVIGLHLFSRGYCGISRVEDEKYCLCYLAHSSLLKQAGNSIPVLEEMFVKCNPNLKKLFNGAEFVSTQPVTISNIRFGMRATSGAGIIQLGDAAGCISPLTGNGISMAAWSALTLSELTNSYFRNGNNSEDLARNYERLWKKQFASRIRTGKALQYLFSHNAAGHLALRILDPLNGIKKKIIASTHGDSF
jgi:flavin-dependent dehydrogenase